MVRKDGSQQFYASTLLAHDAVGNPLTYYNGISDYAFTWINGRQLATAEVDDYVLSYTYNDDGIRTSKTVDGVVHTYRLSGTQIISEEWGANLVIYLYDAEGSPIGMQYRTSSMGNGVFYTFFYEKNLQGDIVAVYNSSGTKLLSYTYDAWGNFTTTWHNNSGTNFYARFNPFTYRGYYYDSELGFYYLNSRYYDPAIGRFINADGLVSTGQGLLGYNMYAYCGNNPVMLCDCSGNCPHKPSYLGDCLDCMSGLPSDNPVYTEPQEDNKEAEIAVAIISNSTGLMVGGFEYFGKKAINNATRPKNIGAGTFAKWQEEDIFILQQNTKNISFLLDGAFVAFDIAIGVDRNLKANAPFDKIVYDVGVDLLCSGGSAVIVYYVSQGIGTAINPGVGTLVGTVVGLTLVVLIDIVPYSNGLSFRDGVKGVYEGKRLK